MSVWMVLSTRLAKPSIDAVLPEDELEVCCTAFLLADAVLRLQVCAVMVLVVLQVVEVADLAVALAGGCLKWMPDSGVGNPGGAVIDADAGS